MKKQLFSSFLAAALTLTSLSFTSPVFAHGGRPIQAVLIGGSSSPTAGGEINLTLNPGQDELCYEIYLHYINTSVVYVSIAPYDPNIGFEDVLSVEPLIILRPPEPGIPFIFDSNGRTQGCNTGIDRDKIKALIQNPEGYYARISNRYSSRAYGQFFK